MFDRVLNTPLGSWELSCFREVSDMKGVSVLRILQYSDLQHLTESNIGFFFLYVDRSQTSAKIYYRWCNVALKLFETKPS